MWEVTLVGGLDDIDYMYTLQQEIYNTFDKSVIVALSSKQNIFCSIATNNKEKVICHVITAAKDYREEGGRVYISHIS